MHCFILTVIAQNTKTYGANRINFLGEVSAVYLFIFIELTW